MRLIDVGAILSWLAVGCGAEQTTLSGRIVDENGEPIAGAWVVLTMRDDTPWPEYPYDPDEELPTVTGRTGDDGRYALTMDTARLAAAGANVVVTKAAVGGTIEWSINEGVDSADLVAPDVPLVSLGQQISAVDGSLVLEWSSTPIDSYAPTFRVKLLQNSSEIWPSYAGAAGELFDLRVVSDMANAVELTARSSDRIADWGSSIAWVEETAIYLDDPLVPISRRALCIFDGVPFEPISGGEECGLTDWWIDGAVADPDEYGSVVIDLGEIFSVGSIVIHRIFDIASITSPSVVPRDVEIRTSILGLTYDLAASAALSTEQWRDYVIVELDAAVDARFVEVRLADPTNRIGSIGEIGVF